MRSTLFRPMLVGSLLFLGIAAAAPAKPAAAQDTQNVPGNRDDDHGFNKGWLGLVGLAGLLGLKRRDDRTTSGIGQDTAARPTTGRV